MCELHGGVLADISSSEEQAFIESLVQRQNGIKSNDFEKITIRIVCNKIFRVLYAIKVCNVKNCHNVQCYRAYVLVGRK